MATKEKGFSGDEELDNAQATQHAQTVAKGLVHNHEATPKSLPPGPVDVEKVGTAGLVDFVKGIAEDGNEVLGVRLPVAADADQPQAPEKFKFPKGWICPVPPESIDRVASGAAVSDEEIVRYIDPEMWAKVEKQAVGCNVATLNHLATRLYVAFEVGGFDCLDADKKFYPRVDKNEMEGSFQTLFMQRLLGRDLHARLRNAAEEKQISTIAALNYGIQSLLNKGLL